MKAVLVALALVAVPVLLAVPASADPIGDPWTCIPESPCCETLICKPDPEPCRVGQYYIC